MKTLKLGFIGAGFVSNFHARALTQVRGVDVAGVTSRSTERAVAFSRLIKEEGLGEGVV
jgi:predicted dehydrogenase